MTMYSEKRRFVAGAICPRCSEMDTVVVYAEDGKDYRECVSCGYKDEMYFKPQTRELETRVNTPEEEKQAQEQVVKILPFDNS
ncbi:YheV family putative zinc ribbon protein [Marinimicrobium alkaliphilum]|uniref:YheV family putative zinc ribbon protein n=1 Tax=Marinimicrobium alkaliphilum TaxID=2202654 RepID=UPI001E2C0F85|nr:YheV family putative zinc ribbon protein [Marinimicrobium alkaliphilum]